MTTRQKAKPLTFISYAHEDEAVAFSLRNWIAESLLDGNEFFIAADRASIPLGEDSPKQINNALRRCAAALLVVTPASVERKWIYFEAGAAFARNVPVIPVCCQGFKKRQLTPPLSFLQAVQLPGSRDARELVDSLARLCGLRAPRNLPALHLPPTAPTRLPARKGFRAKPTRGGKLEPTAGEILASAAVAGRKKYAEELLAAIRRSLRASPSLNESIVALRSLLATRLRETRQHLEQLRQERDSLVTETQKSPATASASRGFTLIGLADAVRDADRVKLTLDVMLLALDKSAMRGASANSVFERMAAVLEAHLGDEAACVRSRKIKL